PAAGCSSLPLDELDLVARGVFDEGDHGRAVLHGPGLADDLVAERADLLARSSDVVRPDRDVAEGVAELVLRAAPVVRELDDGVRGLVAVTDETEGEFPLGVLLLTEDLHPERLGVELLRGLE